MITAHFYKQISEKFGDNSVSRKRINRLVEIKCLKVLKEIEKYIVSKGNYGTALNHIDGIARILKGEGYDIEW